MYLIQATLREPDGSGTYFYGPYETRTEAAEIIERAEVRKGDRAPDMTIVGLQSSDAFLLGHDARTYSLASSLQGTRS